MNTLLKSQLCFMVCYQVNDELVEIEEFPNLINGVLWENSSSDRGIFIAYDSTTIYTYKYSRHTMKGRLTLIDYLQLKLVCPLY